MLNPYELLELSPNAPSEDVHDAFRRADGKPAADRAAIESARRQLADPSTRLATDAMLLVPELEEDVVPFSNGARWVPPPSPTASDLLRLLLDFPFTGELSTHINDLRLRTDLAVEPCDFLPEFEK